MSDPGVEQEIQLQFAKDEAAFNGLSPRVQNVANRVAAIGFYCRDFVADTCKAVAGTADRAFYLLFRAPYILMGSLARGLLNGMVSGVKLGVVGVSKLLVRFSDPNKAQSWQRKVQVWQKETLEKIDQKWDAFKERVHVAAKKTVDLAEKHVALGLYRATDWLLNPKTPSGKPLFGNARLNKVIGSAATAGVFLFLTFELTKVAVLAKIWHIKFAHSMVHDTAPLWIKVLKQCAFHPMLTAGLTGLKFLTLPMIAASRQSLKATKFTQGVAYKYNVILNADKASPKEVKRMRILSRLASFTFARKVIEHIVEKASPEFYRARLKHYYPKQLLQVHQVEGKSVLADMELGKTFNDAQAVVKPPQEVPEPFKALEQPKGPPSSP